MINKKKTNSTDYNYGIGFLKIILSMLVVNQHILDWSVHDTKMWMIIRKFQQIHVPSFMIIAFMLTDVSEVTNAKFKSRLERLLSPVMFWGLIYYIIYLMIDKVYGLNLIERKRDIIYQLIFGSKFNSTLWFQFAIILSTIIIFCLFKFLSKEDSKCILLLTAVASLFMQYSNISYYLFVNMNDSYKLSIAGWFECIPYVTIGVFVGTSRIFDKVSTNKARYTIIFSCISIIFMWVNYDIFYKPKGFMYAGLDECIMSFIIVLLFYILPIKYLNKRVKSFIKFISKYTVGVYCIHRLVAQILCLNSKLLPMKVGSMVYVLFVYMLSVSICYILSRVPLKGIKNSVM